AARGELAGDPFGLALERGAHRRGRRRRPEEKDLVPGAGEDRIGWHAPDEEGAAVELELLAKARVGSGVSTSSWRSVVEIDEDLRSPSLGEDARHELIRAVEEIVRIDEDEICLRVADEMSAVARID